MLPRCLSETLRPSSGITVPPPFLSGGSRDPQHLPRCSQSSPGPPSPHHSPLWSYLCPQGILVSASFFLGATCGAPDDPEALQDPPNAHHQSPVAPSIAPRASLTFSDGPCVPTFPPQGPLSPLQMPPKFSRIPRSPCVPSFPLWSHLGPPKPSPDASWGLLKPSRTSNPSPDPPVAPSMPPRDSQPYPRDPCAPTFPLWSSPGTPIPSSDAS